MSKARLTSALTATALSSLAGAQTSPETQRIAESLGTGVNFGNTLEAPEVGRWGLLPNEWMFDTTKQLGFDSVRLPVRWSVHANTEPPYTIDPAFFGIIDATLELARERDLPIVLNVHHYHEIFEAPDAHEPRLAALWRQIAERYAPIPDDQLLFELLNEPHDKLTPERWNAMIPALLAAVRESNPTRPVLIGPGNWNNLKALDQLVLPDDENIIVTVHYYLPFKFTHQGARWLDLPSQDWLGTTWPSDESGQAELDAHFDTIQAWAEAQARPVNIGEFGAFNKADMDSRARWTRAVRDAAASRGMSMHYWELASVFGLVDPSTEEPRAPLIEALRLGRDR